MATRMDSNDVRSMPGQSTGAMTSGWVTCGGALLLLLGGVNFVHGITALQYDDLLVNSYVYDNLTFWGWAFVVWGALQFAAGIATLMGSMWGPSLGIGLATFGAIGWFFMIFAAPAAAIVGVLISMAIIASLAPAMAE